MLAEFREMCEKDSYPNDYLRRACALYKAAKNVEKKAADGITPALNALSILNDVEDLFGNIDITETYEEESTGTRKQT